MAWRIKGGGIATVDASTSYQIDTEEEQDGMLHRFVLMKSVCRGKSLKKAQSVGLFRELPKALWLATDADLRTLDTHLATIP
jgi:hypothetical protein